MLNAVFESALVYNTYTLENELLIKILKEYIKCVIIQKVEKEIIK